LRTKESSTKIESTIENTNNSQDNIIIEDKFNTTIKVITKHTLRENSQVLYESKGPNRVHIVNNDLAHLEVDITKNLSKLEMENLNNYNK